MALRTSPLSDVHTERGASVTAFGGWEMPVDFGSIRQEHSAVREAVGRFDVSHMGEILVSGPDSETLMDKLTTNDVSALDPGEAQYSMITDTDGIILDDTVVYRLPTARDAEYLFVPNAGHDTEMYERWTSRRSEWELDVTVANVTDEYGLLAFQGPGAEGLLAGECEHPDRLEALEFFAAMDTRIAGVDVLVSRTGYTGEDGFEILCPWDRTEHVWTAFDCQACGLGARDTLRIEMGYLLSGQDFHPEDNPRTPFEAGVGFTVALDTEFVGRDALAAAEERGLEETFAGVRLLERGVPRHGYDIADSDGRIVGEVTSGTMSPTLEEPIGLGYLPVEYSDPGTSLAVVVRDQLKEAVVETVPFIDH